MDNNKDLVNAIKELTRNEAKKADELKNLNRNLKDLTDVLKDVKDKLGTIEFRQNN